MIGSSGRNGKYSSVLPIVNQVQAEFMLKGVGAPFFPVVHEKAEYVGRSIGGGEIAGEVGDTADMSCFGLYPTLVGSGGHSFS